MLARNPHSRSLLAFSPSLVSAPRLRTLGSVMMMIPPVWSSSEFLVSAVFACQKQVSSAKGNNTNYKPTMK